MSVCVQSDHTRVARRRRAFWYETHPVQKDEEKEKENKDD